MPLLAGPWPQPTAHSRSLSVATVAQIDVLPWPIPPINAG